MHGHDDSALFDGVRPGKWGWLRNLDYGRRERQLFGSAAEFFQGGHGTGAGSHSLQILNGAVVQLIG